MEVTIKDIKKHIKGNYTITDKGCWEYNGKIKNNGYGYATFRRNGKLVNFYAHRMMWILFYGKIPDGMFVCHHCDNRKCVSPYHLFTGTSNDNIQDMIKKGRKVYWQKLKTHCKHGHEFTQENTYIRNNKRNCKKCMRRLSDIYHIKYKEDLKIKRKERNKMKKAGIQ